MSLVESVKLANNLYYLGSIATIMDYPDTVRTDKTHYGYSTNGKICTVKVNDDITLNAVFGQLGPDIFSLTDYEIDELHVQIMKHDKVAGLLNFHSSFKNSNYIGINTPRFTDEVKLHRIEKMKPNAFERVQQVLNNFQGLTVEDVMAINGKAEEAREWAFEKASKSTRKH